MKHPLKPSGLSSSRTDISHSSVYLQQQEPQQQEQHSRSDGGGPLWWVCFCGSSGGSADTTHRQRFLVGLFLWQQWWQRRHNTRTEIFCGFVERKRESRAGSGGGTQGRSLSRAQEQSFHRLKRGREREQSKKRWWDPGPLSLARANHALVAHVRDVDDGSGIISNFVKERSNFP